LSPLNLAGAQLTLRAGLSIFAAADIPGCGTDEQNDLVE